MEIKFVGGGLTRFARDMVPVVAPRRPWLMVLEARRGEGGGRGGLGFGFSYSEFKRENKIK